MKHYCNLGSNSILIYYFAKGVIEEVMSRLQKLDIICFLIYFVENHLIPIYFVTHYSRSFLSFFNFITIHFTDITGNYVFPIDKYFFDSMKRRPLKTTI